MGADAEPLAEIARDRPEVGAGAHRGPKDDLRRLIPDAASIRCTVTVTRPRLDSASPSGEPVASLSVHLLGGVGRRPLLAASRRTPPAPPGQPPRSDPRCPGPPIRSGAPVRSSVSVRDAEARGGQVRLGMPLDEPRESGRPPDQHHQESGRERIERAGVSHRPDRRAPAGPAAPTSCDVSPAGLSTSTAPISRSPPRGGSRSAAH